MLLLRHFIVVVGLMVSVAQDTMADCPTFKDVKLDEPFRCDEDCMANNNKDVFGTLIYGEDSDVCQSGLHAGAVKMSGGQVKIQQVKSTGRYVHGTCRNRVCSKGLKRIDGEAGFVVKETETVVERVGSDVIVVHNNYWDDLLNLVCMTEDDTASLTSDDTIRKWNYDHVTGELKVPSKILVTSASSSNKHAYHCTGKSPVSDVFAPINFPNADFKSSQYTYRTSNGGAISMDVSYPEAVASNIPIIRFPTDGSGVDISLRIASASPENSGLYLIGDNMKGAYVSVIVRDCEAGKYGSECQLTCPKCQNGGQCHSYTGECLCPPGFTGDSCQRACASNTFGTECQFQCNEKTLLFGLPEKGTCKGLTICQPSPLGCSCPAGYKGPICDDMCAIGEYGAGCSESCQSKCKTIDCDSFTGKCTPTKPMNLRTTTSSVPGTLSVSWDKADNADEDHHRYNISYKLLEKMSCSHEDPNEDWTRLEKDEQPVIISDLENHSSYNVCISVSDDSGKSSPEACVTASTNIQEPTVNVTELTCIADGPGGIFCSATVLGSCSHFNGPMVTLMFSLTAELKCNKSQILVEEKESLSSNSDQLDARAINHTFIDIIPGLTYLPSVRVEGVAVPKDIMSDVITSDDNIPPPPIHVVAEDESNSVRVSWENPCPSNRKLLEYKVTAGDQIFEIGEGEVVCSGQAKVTQRCYVIDDLSPGTLYNVSVAVGSSYSWSKQVNITHVMKYPKLGKPGLSSSRTASSVEVKVSKPSNYKGVQVNCTVTGGPKPCTLNFTEDLPMMCHFNDLTGSKEYKLKGQCCKENQCGSINSLTVRTKAEAQLEGEPYVWTITNTTMEVYLPQLVKTGDAISHMAIIVERIPEGGNRSRDWKKRMDFTLKSILSKTAVYSGGGGEVVSYPFQSYESSYNRDCSADIYVTARLSLYVDKFDIGNNFEYRGVINCPLTYNETYALAFAGIVTLGGEITIVWQEMEEFVRLVPITGRGLVYFVLLIVGVVIFVLAMMWPVFCSKRKPMENEDEEGLHVVEASYKKDPEVTE